jgi:hypothetical protein
MDTDEHGWNSECRCIIQNGRERMSKGENGNVGVVRVFWNIRDIPPKGGTPNHGVS